MATTRSTDPALSVANTILRQLGGSGALQMMIGAKHFLGDDHSLTFKWSALATNKANCVVITLTRDDEYDVRFCRVSGIKVLEKGTTRGVQVAQLRPLFESATKLRLSL